MPRLAHPNPPAGIQSPQAQIAPSTAKGESNPKAGTLGTTTTVNVLAGPGSRKQGG